MADAATTTFPTTIADGEIRYGGNLAAEYQADLEAALTLAKAARRYFHSMNLQVLNRWTRKGRGVRGHRVKLPSILGVKDGHACRIVMPQWCEWFIARCVELGSEERPVWRPAKRGYRRRDPLSDHEAVMARLRKMGAVA